MTAGRTASCGRVVVCVARRAGHGRIGRRDLLQPVRERDPGGRGTERQRQERQDVCRNARGEPDGRGPPPLQSDVTGRRAARESQAHPDTDHQPSDTKGPRLILLE